MSTKSYRLLVDSRQLKGRAGETVTLTPRQAKYLVSAGLLEEVSPTVDAPAGDVPTVDAPVGDAAAGEQGEPPAVADPAGPIRRKRGA